MLFRSSLIALIVIGTIKFSSTFKLPPSPANFDYQLGGGYNPDSRVNVVTRDMTDSAAPSLYSICYINGFQAQPDSDQFWLKNHNELVLRDANGNIVKDTDWNELILDISTADKRTKLLAVVEPWIKTCADKGYQAVEFDNLDTYSRSKGLISQQNAVDMIKLYA